jgi:hypothetical protein
MENALYSRLGNMIALWIFIMLSLVTLRSFLTGDSFLIHRDLVWPMDNRDLLANIFYSQDLEGLRRAFYLAPIFGIANIFGLSSLDVEKMVFLIVRVFTGFFAFYAISNFIGTKVKANKNDKYIFLVAIFGGFFYAYNPIATSMVSSTLGFAFSYAMLPLSLYFFDRALSKRDFQSILLAGIMISLTLAGTTQYLVLLSLFLLIPWFIITILSQRNRTSVITTTSTLLFVGASVILISSFWILPAVVSNLSGVALEPGYVITTDFLEIMNDRTPLDKVVRLMGDWWPRVELTPLFDETAWIFLTFVIPASVILFMIFPSRPIIKFYILAFFLISLLIMFFNQGFQLPSSGLYASLLDIPIIGWMFRIPSKFAMILAFTFTMLISLGLYGLISNRSIRFRKPVIYSLSLTLLISTTLIGWPMFTGDLGGVYQDMQYLPILDEPSSRSSLVFTPPEQNFAVVGDSHQLDLLDTHPAVDINNHSSIVFLDQVLGSHYDTTVVNNLVINDKDSVLMHFIPNDSIILSPFDNTKRYSPMEVWSRAKTNYAMDGSFPAYLERYSIHTSDLDYNRGIVFTLAHDSLHLPFNIIDDGNYELFIRYMESKEGGTINIRFDEQPPYSLTTLGTTDGFKWKNIGNLHLTADRHVITLENTGGFNAVNLLILIPSEALQNQHHQVEDFFRSSRTIHVLNSENFIPVMSQNATGEVVTSSLNESTDRNLVGELDTPDVTFDSIMESSFNSFSNVQVSMLVPDAELITRIEPITSSNYIMSFLVETCNDCTTALRVTIGDSSHELPLITNDANFKWFNIQEYLPSEGADIKVSSSSPMEFGGLIMFTLPNDPSGSEMTASESSVLEIDLDEAEINPTRYKVNANLSAPFILKFEKPFSSLWKANVNGEEYRSIQILAEESEIFDLTQVTGYTAVNGFLIDKTGELDITIEYAPHQWFQIGLAFSLGTLGLSFIYLVWQKWKQGNKINKTEKPKADSSIDTTLMSSTNRIERIGNNNSIVTRDNQILFIVALVLLLSLPFLIATDQDNSIISNLMGLTYVLLIIGGISLFVFLINPKARHSVTTVKRSPV